MWRRDGRSSRWTCRKSNRSEQMNVSIVAVVIVVVAVVAAGAYFIATWENGEREVPEYVTISGTIIYEDYSQGEILIGAYENIYLMPPGTIIGIGPLQESIGAVTILSPGPYSFTVPANCGEVWVAAINDSNDDGVFDVDIEPAGRYVGNPMTVGMQNIEDMNVTLQPGGLF